jgi:hypothetical protein
MLGGLLIFALTLVTFLPLAGILLYVWWKYGKGDLGVSLARTVFLGGSLLLLFILITV